MQIRFAVLLSAATLLAAGCGMVEPQAKDVRGTPTSYRSEFSPVATASASAAASTITATPRKTTIPSNEPTTSPSPSPILYGRRTVTEADSDKTVVLAIGETLNVSLPSEYDPPVAQGDAVVRTSSTGGYPTGRPVRASFRGARAGRADITSSTDYACLHSTPQCMIPQRLWIVHVIVKS